MSGEESERSAVEARAQPVAGAAKSDLKPRVIAGVAMALAAIALTYAGPMPFAAMVGLVALLMCWEWGRVVRSRDFGPQLAVHALAVAVAVGLAAFGRMQLALAALAAGALLLYLAPIGGRREMSAAGVAYVGLPAVSLIWFRNDAALGLQAVLFIFVVVWTSDIAAYAAGRTFGGPKLWRRVSPNKTWSGFVGGITASAIAGGMFAYFLSGASAAALAATALLLALVAQLGDLAESALKRLFGVKDTSAIIPGHGGVMDRADSIVAVSVVAALFAIVYNAAAPAVALLIGG